MRIRAFLLTAAALTLAACGGDDSTTVTTDAPAEAPVATEAPAAPEAPAATYDGPAAEVEITPVGEEMRYAVEAFTVAPGQEVNLTFNNTATSPAMRHNVVVLQQGVDANAFGQAAMAAADNDYVPADRMSEVVAHTPMSDPGQTVEVTFTAPSTPGTYTFICTFPGHYMTMRGTMTVEAQPS